MPSMYYPLRIFCRPANELKIGCSQASEIAVSTTSAAFCFVKPNTSLTRCCRTASLLKTTWIWSKPEQQFDCLQCNRPHNCMASHNFSCQDEISLANEQRALTYRCVVQPICCNWSALLNLSVIYAEAVPGGVEKSCLSGVSIFHRESSRFTLLRVMRKCNSAKSDCLCFNGNGFYTLRQFSLTRRFVVLSNGIG